jgi:lipopolysaccharide transport protein LptA
MKEKYKIFVLICILVSILGMITSTTAEDTALTDKGQTSVKRKITADSLRWEYEQKTAVFTGNVNMTAKEGNITASKMTVFFDDNDEIINMVAEGNADLIREKQKGGGEIIEIYPSNNLIILKGAAWISSDKASFKGEEINFDTEKEIINITQGVKGEIKNEK